MRKRNTINVIQYKAGGGGEVSTPITELAPHFLRIEVEIEGKSYPIVELMNFIQEAVPLFHEYPEDARYQWPQRWMMIQEMFIETNR
jgi:hypothetical protein